VSRHEEVIPKTAMKFSLIISHVPILSIAAGITQWYNAELRAG